MTRLAMLWLAASIALSAAPAVAQDQPITVFVVRHAEKGPDGQDPSLTDAGRARAAALARMLGDAGVTAVITSQFKRTVETGAPVAERAGVTAQVVGAGKNDELVAAVRGLTPGSKAVVVTHSNLVSVIVEKLSGQKVSELTDADYDRIYVVTLRPQGGSVLYLHYGAPSPTGTAPMRP